ncbi:MAG: dihydrolipoamide acetyltransferase family protein, partial [Bacteroidota bacterium]
IDVIMPQMGESIVEGTIVKWHRKVGEGVKKDEILLEISTDKVDSEIPSPAEGTLAEILVDEQQTVPVNTVIARLETEAGAPVSKTESPVAPEASKPEAPPPVPEPAAPKPVPLVHPRPTTGRFFSPLVMTIAQTEGVSMEELERVSGSGEAGRVTKRDILAYVDARKRGTAHHPSAGASLPEAGVGPRPVTVAQPVDAPELSAKYPSPQHEILQMSNVLQKMAQHMVKSVQTSPHVFGIHEVDMTGVVQHRSLHAGEFEKKEGFKLTYTPYIADAIVRALKKYPLINSSVEGDKIIKKNFINLGIAVASDNGLIVPVIKHAEEKNFLGLARAVHDLASRTRTKKLTPEDIQGGTFTVSNFGVFGTVIGTPIISQPQVAILGTGAIRKRVVVVDDALAIRSMAYFTLSFDHRIIDGALGGQFLEEIIGYLEGFEANAKLS